MELTPMAIGLINLIFMLLLMFMGMPIAYTFIVAGLTGITMMLGLDMAINYVSTLPFTAAASYTFCVMPLFMLMGDIAYEGGLTSSAYDSARKWFGHMPGGLSITTTVASAIFGAVCGSGSATSMVMTQVAWPEMKKSGYKPTIGLGSIAAAGPLAILIPPSVPLIMYGILTEQSIGKLFMAGWLPGILLCIILSLTTVIWVKLNPPIAPRLPKVGMKEKLLSVFGIWPIVVLIILVMGGIWGGIFTVNEGAGVGAAGAFLIACLKRKLTVKSFFATIKGVATLGASMFFMFVGIQVFNIFMALSGLPKALATWITTLEMSPMSIIWCIVILYVILGALLDEPPIIMLTIPLLAPIVAALGFNMIWFGIVVTFTSAIGAIAPPVAINIFVIKSRVPEVPTSQLCKGVVPFLIATFVTLVIIMYIPEISTLLPDMMYEVR